MLKRRLVKTNLAALALLTGCAALTYGFVQLVLWQPWVIAALVLIVPYAIFYGWAESIVKPPAAWRERE